MTTRNMDDASKRTLIELIGFTHIEHGDPTGSDTRLGGGRVDFVDLGFGLGKQVTERRHGRKPTEMVGICYRANASRINGGPTAD